MPSGSPVSRVYAHFGSLFTRLGHQFQISFLIRSGSVYLVPFIFFKLLELFSFNLSILPLSFFLGLFDLRFGFSFLLLFRFLGEVLSIKDVHAFVGVIG